MFTKHRLKYIARRLHLLQIASWTYELYRLIRKPNTHGSLVAIWLSNQLLMVQTSYRRGYGLPGGGIQAGESASWFNNIPGLYLNIGTLSNMCAK